jgi:hypothetical protein
MFIATSFVKVLRRPLEFALAALIRVEDVRLAEAGQRFLER